MARREQFGDEIQAVLASGLDRVLAKEGFGRGQGQRNYYRKTGLCTQTILYHFEVRPRDDPSRQVLFRPKLQVFMPALSRIAVGLTGQDSRILPAPDCVLAMPLCPGLIRERKFGWFADDEGERLEAMRQACAGIVSGALPFLNNMQSAEDLVSLHENRDSRLRLDARMIIFIAAAYIYRERQGEACTLVQSYFGKPAMARRYSVVLEAVCQGSGVSSRPL